ncbi:MAG: hypothetical protein ACK5Z6_12875, partial [Hyphomonadaceae bacterium]
LNLKVIKQLGRYFLMSHHHQIPRKSMKPVNHDPQTLTTTSFSTISAQSGPKAKLGTPSSLALLTLNPPDNCYCARCGVKGRASGASAKPISPLDASSCVLKLEHGLCQGRAYGKGCPSRKS